MCGAHVEDNARDWVEGSRDNLSERWGLKLENINKIYYSMEYSK